MEINNISAPTLSYKGLTSQCKKAVHTREGFAALQNFYPNSGGIVGNLPSFWVKNMPAKNRETFVKGLYNDLGEFFADFRAKLLSEINSTYDIAFDALNNIEDSQDKTMAEHIKDITKKTLNARIAFSTLNSILTGILKKYKAIEEDASVKIYFADSGVFSYGFTVEDIKNNKRIFLKVFNDFAYNNDWLGQGPGLEANNNVYIQHNLKTKSDKKHFPKFYYADTANGYYIEEYLGDRGVEVSDDIIDKNASSLIEKIEAVLEKISLGYSDGIIGNIKVFVSKTGELIPVLFDCGGVIPLEKFKPIREKYNTIFKYWL